MNHGAYSRHSFLTELSSRGISLTPSAVGADKTFHFSGDGRGVVVLVGIIQTLGKTLKICAPMLKSTDILLLYLTVRSDREGEGQSLTRESRRIQPALFPY